MLAVEFAIHQHIIDVDELFGGVEEILDDLQARLAFPHWSRIQHDGNGVPDELDGGPLVGVLFSLLFGADDFVFVTGTVAREWVGFGRVNGDDASAMECTGVGGS
jgi:hypothetical protein